MENAYEDHEEVCGYDGSYLPMQDTYEYDERYVTVEHIPTVGTLEKNQSWFISEWIIVDFKTLFRDRRYSRKIAKSPTFHMKDATWSLAISSSVVGFNEKGFFVDLQRHQLEAASLPLWYQIVVKGDEHIVGGYAEEMSFKGNSEMTGCIAESSRFLSRIGNGRVSVLCTFYEVGQKQILKDGFGSGKHSKKNLEGIDILLSQMKNLFLNRENCDFVIKVKGREFQVHKAILSARSPVLAAMLQHDMAEKNNNATEIIDSEPDIFEKFLLYIYSGQVEELSWENATSLYILGDKYDLEHLRKECVEFMKDNFCIDAFCDVTTLAVRHNLPNLVKSAEEFFLKNVTEILLTPKWQLLLKEHPVTCNELFVKYSNSSKLK